MVSIIVPVYNAEKYLGECVRSIVAQTYSRWELILINDGSTDSSGAIAARLASADPRIRLIETPNRGAAAARNAGLDAAKGDFICFVDADDCLLPDSIEVWRDLLNTSGADIIASSYTDRADAVTPGRTVKKLLHFGPLEAACDMLYQKHILSSPWGKLFRTSALRNVRFGNFRCYEDLDFMYHALLAAHEVVYTPRALYFYRDTPDSLIKRWNPGRLHVLDVTEGIEKSASKQSPELLAAARDRRLSANFNIFALATIHGESDVAALCWKIIRRYRREALKNPKVRLKNKLGALLSYLGPHIFATLLRPVYSKQ